MNLGKAPRINFTYDKTLLNSNSSTPSQFAKRSLGIPTTLYTQIYSGTLLTLWNNIHDSKHAPIICHIRNVSVFTIIDKHRTNLTGAFLHSRRNLFDFSDPELFSMVMLREHDDYTINRSSSEMQQQHYSPQRIDFVFVFFSLLVGSCLLWVTLFRHTKVGYCWWKDWKWTQSQ